MKQHIPEELSTRLVDWSPLVIIGNTVPPAILMKTEEDDEEDDNADKPPVVREPDEDLTSL